jgi:hypothetical protein
LVKENEVLIFVTVVTSKNNLMNSNEGISPMFIDPIAHKWLVNRVVIQDFDGHQELYEKHEPLLASVIILSIMSIKLMKGGQSQEHEQTGNGYA